MIEEPPLLTISAQAERRPTAAQLAAFRDAPTGFVADAMDGVGALSLAIAPLSPRLPERMVGPALTCDSGPGDLLALLAALASIRPGDVIVNAFAGHLGCAALGDRVCGMAKNAGAAGLVTDGPARDIEGIEEIGLPVYAAGLSPNSPVATGPGFVGLPIQIGGRRVETGDIVIADRNGVVIVPFAEIDRVAERLKTVASLEAALDAEVAEGLILPPSIAETLASDRVRRTP